MPSIVPRHGYGIISYSFYSGTFNNVNLQTRFGNTKYLSQVNKRVIIYPDATITSQDHTQYAFTIPEGYGGNIYIINRGLITGACGDGKKTLGGGNGGDGGDAIYAGAGGTSGGISDSLNKTYIDNRDGTIAGGGGGGARGQSDPFIEGEGGDDGTTPWFFFAQDTLGDPIDYYLEYTRGRAGPGGNGRCETLNETGISLYSVVNITGNVNIGTNNNTVELPMGRPTYSGNVNVGGNYNIVYVPNYFVGNVNVSGFYNTVYIGQNATGNLNVSGVNNTLYYPSTINVNTSASNTFINSPIDRTSPDLVINSTLIATRPDPTAPDGGAGGDWGQPGGDASWPGRTTYYGGAGGNYIVNNSNVTWLYTGNVYGGVS